MRGIGLPEAIGLVLIAVLLLVAIVTRNAP